MAIKTKAQLKAYFTTGSKPTQAQFEDLIDSVFNDNIADMPLASSTSNGLMSIADKTLVDLTQRESIVLNKTIQSSDYMRYHFVDNGYVTTFANALYIDNTLSRPFVTMHIECQTQTTKHLFALDFAVSEAANTICASFTNFSVYENEPANTINYAWLTFNITNKSITMFDFNASIKGSIQSTIMQFKLLRIEFKKQQ